MAKARFRLIFSLAFTLLIGLLPRLAEALPASFTPEVEMQMRPIVRAMALELAIRFPMTDETQRTLQRPIDSAEEVNLIRLQLFKSLERVPPNFGLLDATEGIANQLVENLLDGHVETASAKAVFAWCMNYMGNHADGRAFIRRLQLRQHALQFKSDKSVLSKIQPVYRQLIDRLQARLKTGDLVEDVIEYDELASLSPEAQKIMRLRVVAEGDRLLAEAVVAVRTVEQNHRDRRLQASLTCEIGLVADNDNRILDPRKSE